jgi:hypothetical protein
MGGDYLEVLDSDEEAECTDQIKDDLTDSRDQNLSASLL